MRAPRILITRLSHIGDCILTIPMLAAIRSAYPDAFIAWAVESPTQQLLKNHPGIDQIIMIEKGWLGKPKQWAAVGRELKRYQFDIAIDPQGLTKSAMLGWLSGAKQRIGAKGRWGRELSPWLNNELVVAKSDHVTDRSMELLTPLGIESPEVDLELPTDPASNDSMKQWLNQNSLSEFAVINPGGSWASKRWENKRFGGIAKHLNQQHQLKTIITWAGEQEQSMAQEIVNLNPAGSLLAPPTTLNQLASVLAMANFFIGCDTGPTHIANAVGTPCVGLYGTTRPEESGAYGDHNIAVQKWYQAGSCKQRRRAANDAMRDIQISDVAEACDRMIANVCPTRNVA